MKFLVQIEDQEHEVVVMLNDDKVVMLTVDGEPVADTALRSNGGIALISKAAIEQGFATPPDSRREMQVFIDGATVRLRCLTSGEYAADQRRNVGQGGDGALEAPMPGRIIDVPVAAGDSVQAGQTLVIVEAMKMQNELRAEHDAKVSSVHVSAGDSIERGALLVSFENN